MRPTVLAYLILAPLFALPTEATAAVYEFDCAVGTTCPSSDGAGRMIDSVFRFNDATLDFRWTATFDTDGTETPDGVWFVINHGPEPKDSDKGLAIFYGDGDSGRVSAYVYDNGRKRQSWKLDQFLETYPMGISFTPLGDDLVELDVSINVASVNGAFPADPDWQGLFYQDTIGFWAAALTDTRLRFDDDGRITKFQFNKRTTYDRSERLTIRQDQEIPAPATLSLLACGLLGLALRRR